MPGSRGLPLSVQLRHILPARRHVAIDKQDFTSLSFGFLVLTFPVSDYTVGLLGKAQIGQKL